MRHCLYQHAHSQHVGAKQLDKVLVNQLDVVLDELSDAMWA